MNCQYAYADPPYPGQALKLYKHDPHQSEVDHSELIQRLCDCYPYGWALSTASTTLQYVLSIAPASVRVAAWVKPFASFKPNVNPAYTWEPVVWMGGRKRLRTEPTVRDYVSANITLKKGLTGAKPEAFNLWILDLLGVREGDELCDLYPGTRSMQDPCESRGVIYRTP